MCTDAECFRRSKEAVTEAVSDQPELPVPRPTRLSATGRRGRQVEKDMKLEAEEIVQMRTRKGKRQYLLKWKGKPE